MTVRRGYLLFIICFLTVFVFSGCVNAVFRATVLKDINKGCGLEYSPGIRKNISQYKWVQIDWERGVFCVATFDQLEKPAPTPAEIPLEVISFTLTEFAGFKGNEPGFHRMIEATQVGIRVNGQTYQTYLHKNNDQPVLIKYFYIAEYKHLSVQIYDKDNLIKARANAVDLSDVDVSLKPEVSEKALQQDIDPDAKLRRLKKLRDDGIITEDEFLEQKRKILENY